MADTSKINDKVIFTVSFLALLLALSSYKAELDNIKLNYFYFGFSLYNALLYMTAILFLSVYANAIENLNALPYRDYPKYTEFFGKLADFLYEIAILEFPSAIILLAFSSFVSSQILQHTDLNADFVHMVTSSFITFIIAFPYLLWKNHLKKVRDYKIIKENIHNKL